MLERLQSFNLRAGAMTATLLDLIWTRNNSFIAGAQTNWGKP